MATVRISGELRSNILRKANEMFADRIIKAETPPPHWGDAVYQAAFGVYAPQYGALPEGTLNTVSSISILGFKGGGWDTTLNETCNLHLSSERLSPNSVDDAYSLYGIRERSWSGWFLNASDTRWDIFKAEYLTFCTAVHAVRVARDTFTEGVEVVLDTYSTLSPALKAWPALWDLLPEHIKDRHRLVVERTKVAAKDAEMREKVDLNKLTGQVTANKLTR